MARENKVSKKNAVKKATGGKKIKKSAKPGKTGKISGKSVKKGKKVSAGSKTKKSSGKVSAKKSSKKVSKKIFTRGKTKKSSGKKTSGKISAKKSSKKVLKKVSIGGKTGKSSGKKTSGKISTKKVSTSGKVKKSSVKKASGKVSQRKSAKKVSTGGRTGKSSGKKTSGKISAKKVSVVGKAKKLAREEDNYLKKVPKVSGKRTSKKEKGVDQTRKKESSETKIVIQRDIVLTDAEGRVLCRVRDCDQPAGVEAYCRYHYLLYWKKIQIRKKILSEGKLEKYIEELTSRYPNKYLELIKKDLSTEMEFLHAIQELDIDESSGSEDQDYDEERSFIEEVRGVSENSEHDKGDY